MNRWLRLGIIVVVGLGLGVAVYALLPAPPSPEASPPAAAPSAGAAQSVLSVSLTRLEPRVWPVSVTATGALAPWHEAVIGVEVGSLRLTEILVDVGAVVRKGQELARLADDAPRATVHKQEAQVAQADAALAQAEAEAKRARAIKNSGALSDQQISDYLIKERTARASLAAAQAELETARIDLNRTVIRAVDDGIITKRSAELGAVVTVGTELFRLLRQGRVEWQAEVDATTLPRIAPGQEARLTLPGGRAVTGTVRLVAPTLDSKTSRALVYVALPPDSGARPGSYATGDLLITSRETPTLPQTAVVLRDGRPYAFVVDGENRVSRRLLITGQRREGRVEILGGLEAEARVVVAGGAFLSEGARVHVVADPAPSPPQTESRREQGS
ncbi:efflux RND transporter periplasmic adaptor subunit [Pararhodospirillum photometricum]|uniref:HlyD family secretion protein n=1 Tax=Pararhodospirillum photometricum DSM 122 TaxID=1150469 RepID=H6SJL7_PARPM|nr:efflux RND transporter periplasmic adaptor subunit [Pararhodospirillum photometricum]CCG08182.1 HlyD family secretion protein [Pararhodospirillum photometricum DSM 122]